MVIDWRLNYTATDLWRRERLAEIGGELVYEHYRLGMDSLDLIRERVSDLDRLVELSARFEVHDDELAGAISILRGGGGALSKD